MATEEEKETKRTAKEPAEKKSDHNLRSRVISSAPSVKDKGKGSK